jgi:hypothetical protein
MIDRFYGTLLAAFLVCLVGGTVMPAPDAGCTAYWYETGPNDPPTIVVGCQADLACTGGLCTAVWTQAGPHTEMVCACSNMTYPKCRGTFVWHNMTPNQVPRIDSAPINPSDWRCIAYRCQTACQRESSPNNSLPAGADTPCKCP